MSDHILTSKQQEQIKNRALDTASWRDEQSLAGRRRVGLELRKVIDRSGLLQGKTIDHQQICELIGLQWQVQNLNPMQMPKFLGLYAYKVHFSGFQGTQADLAALRKEETGHDGFYPGADLAVVSEAIRLMSSESIKDHVQGAATLLEVDGAGQALVSGFLHLLHPDKYGLVNTPTKAPFIINGWLNVTEQQRRMALKSATIMFSDSEDVSARVFGKLFRWEVFLQEVYVLCKFSDYHELDQFLWMMSTEPEDDDDNRLEIAIAAIRPEDLAARIDAEKKARQLIEDNLGHLTSDQFAELFTLINTCVGKKGLVYTRFSPGFVGHNANQLIEQSDELNQWIEELWKAKEEEVPNILSQFWENKIAGSGRSFPTAILYLRDKEKVTGPPNTP